MLIGPKNSGKQETTHVGLKIAIVKLRFGSKVSGVL